MIWKKQFEISLDGLGMDDVSMLELVNRMNENDDRKWILIRHRKQMMNPFYRDASLGNKMANNLV